MFVCTQICIIPVVILAEDSSIQEKIGHHDLRVQTFAEVAPLKVYPARVLSHIFAHLGRHSENVGNLQLHFFSI